VDWEAFKNAAANTVVAKDALHIYAAFAVQVLAAAVLRRPLSSWLPWTCVLLAELANECLDIYFSNEPSIQQWQWLGARHDLLNTMALPTALLLLCRYANFLFYKPPGVAAEPEPDGDGEAVRETGS